MKKSSVILTVILGIGMFGAGVLASNHFSDVPSNHWAKGAINSMNASGIMKGDENANTFRPDDNITRAETAVVLERMEDYIKDYVQEYTENRVKAAVTAVEKVIESPIYEPNKSDLIEWTEVSAKKLGLTFKAPNYIESCTESEVILDEIEKIEGFQQKGRKINVGCGDLEMTARTEIYEPYEDHFVGSASVPEAYEMQGGCLFMPTEECLGYKLSLENGQKLYFIVFQWDGGDYYVGTYVPIKGNEYYKAARLVMKVKDKDISIESDEVLKGIVKRNLDEASLKRIQDFELMVIQLT